METFNLCRCCLNKTTNTDMNFSSSYPCPREKENYSDMLQECFNVILNKKTERNLICDLCVKNLHISMNFKRQVLEAETELLKLISGVEDDKTVVMKGLESKLGDNKDDFLSDTNVKPVVKEELNETDGNDSDNYFLADTIKQESPPPQTAKKKLSSKGSLKNKKSTEDYNKIKKLVKKISSIESRDKAQKKSINQKSFIKNRTITIKKDLNINLAWTTGFGNEKYKHRENLSTILKYSNAIPFKDKYLLGYVCGYCDATYPDPVDLRAHTENEHEKQRLDFKSSLDTTEYNIKLDVTDLQCLLCMEKIENLQNLKDHLVKVHSKAFHEDIKDHMMQFKLKKGDVYDCSMCSSTYETFKMLKQHMNKHYSNYSCTKCDTSFATKRSLNAHQATHLEGSFKCDLCDKVFSSRHKKQYHEKTKHLGNRNISNCPLCNAPFRSYYQRNQHMVKVHNSEAQYKCNVCNKSYILKSLLMSHIKKNHLMERNCQCTECGYRFFSKKALNAHMVKHTGERKYCCEVCNKSYARKYTLREHMRIHNNDRRFKCEVCSTAFVQKCSLKSHLLSHHGISMAACEITVS